MLTTNIRVTLVVFAVGASCQVGLLPWFSLPCVLVASFSRWAFCVHARTHDDGSYPLLEELMLLVMSPLSVGMHEQRTNHRQHHAALWTTADPDLVFYRSQPAVAFGLSCLQPERLFIRSCQGMDRWALSRAGLRSALFATLWLIAGNNFLLWYLLPLRVLFGLVWFSFTWLLHHREAARTVNLCLPLLLTPLLGSEVMQGLNSHVAHHAVHEQSTVPATDQAASRSSKHTRSAP